MVLKAYWPFLEPPPQTSTSSQRKGACLSPCYSGPPWTLAWWWWAPWSLLS